MVVFLSRESEAIIPNIFFFLVLLSYERYHSKQIIGIPKIIQLCDGIMASGRKAVTHGNGTNLALWSSVTVMCSTGLVFLHQVPVVSTTALCFIGSVCVCVRAHAFVYTKDISLCTYVYVDNNQI